MKRIRFNQPVLNTPIFNFVPLCTKKDFNDTVSNIQALLKRYGVHCKTSSLKEWLSHACGYNTAAHLLSELPLAFDGMQAIHKLNQTINQKTQWAIYFEALDHQHFSGERWDTVSNPDYSAILDQAGLKVRGTEHSIILLKFRPGAFYDDWARLDDDEWYNCFRAAALIETFPTYTLYRGLRLLNERTSGALLDAMLEPGREGFVVCLDKLLTEIEDDKTFFLGKIEENSPQLIEMLLSYLMQAADEENIEYREGIIIPSLTSKNDSAFVTWLKKQKNRDDIVGDFANDAERDPDFSTSATSYLNTSRHIRQKTWTYPSDDRAAALSAVREAWKEYLSLPPSGVPGREEGCLTFNPITTRPANGVKVILLLRDNNVVAATERSDGFQEGFNNFDHPYFYDNRDVKGWLTANDNNLVFVGQWLSCDAFTIAKDKPLSIHDLKDEVPRPGTFTISKMNGKQHFKFYYAATPDVKEEGHALSKFLNTNCEQK
tara:strand:- start:10278 stop:11744 length:1467 start_codon:yes stop_codon:yes gene_type:complete